MRQRPLLEEQDHVLINNRFRASCTTIGLKFDLSYVFFPVMTYLRVPNTFQRLENFDLNVHHRLDFWDSPDTFSFFQEHGYTLYKRIFAHGDSTCASSPALYLGDFVDACYPYASYDYKSFHEGYLLAAELKARVAFAQDSLGRHVAIKPVQDGSDEHRILRFLHQQPLDTVRDNCLVPVLDLLPAEDFWFAVMPRWGIKARYPEPHTIIEVLDLMHAMLKGLSFLHDHNISHGDINEVNVLVNHFCDAREDKACKIRRELRSQRNLSYALFDFDFSVMLAPGADRSTYRLPYQRSWGTFCKVNDTAQGEFDYNPFVFDVGNMGVLFCNLYQHLTPSVPFLAPLLDMMTAHDLKRRFTASEALQFFEDMFHQMSESQLQAPYWKKKSTVAVTYEQYDRWKSLSPEFVRKWAKYREPTVSRMKRFLRWLCRPTWVYHVVAYVRWSAFRLVSFPRTIYAY